MTRSFLPITFGMTAIVAASSFVACTVTTTTANPDEPQPTDTGTAATPAVTADPTAPPSTPPTGPSVIPIPLPGNSAAPSQPNPNGKANGDACKAGSECASGVCEGQGCDTGPKCVDSSRMCTRDLVTYCGCDGKTFGASGSCPGRPFKKKGECN